MSNTERAYTLVNNLWDQITELEALYNKNSDEFDDADEECCVKTEDVVEMLSYDVRKKLELYMVDRPNPLNRTSSSE